MNSVIKKLDNLSKLIGNTPLVEISLEYKGKPVKFQNTIFISTEHPSRISYDDMLNNIEMIYEAVYHNNYITITA